jgi:DNA-binding CsgD family transcriptional regulator
MKSKRQNRTGNSKGGRQADDARAARAERDAHVIQLRRTTGLSGKAIAAAVGLSQSQTCKILICAGLGAAQSRIASDAARNARVIAMRLDGRSIRATANALGISPRTAGKILAAARVRPPADPRRVRLVARNEEALRLYSIGWPAARIARKLGMSTNRVYVVVERARPPREFATVKEIADYYGVTRKRVARAVDRVGLTAGHHRMRRVPVGRIDEVVRALKVKQCRTCGGEFPVSSQPYCSRRCREAAGRVVIDNKGRNGKSESKRNNRNRRANRKAD